MGEFSTQPKQPSIRCQKFLSKAGVKNQLLQKTSAKLGNTCLVCGVVTGDQGSLVSVGTRDSSGTMPRPPLVSKSDSAGAEEMLSLIRQSLKSCRTPGETNFEASTPHIFVVMGASGDLAKKKIYPTLWWLYRDRLLPENTIFVGYARSGLTVNQIREKCNPYMKVKDDEQDRHLQFWSVNHYVKGSYDTRRDFELLDQEMVKVGTEKANRIFYLALPPSVFDTVTSNIKGCCMAKQGWTRVIIEKPFGRDSESSAKLSNHLAGLFKEEEMYRIDHYLGKEMVQNLMSLRYENVIVLKPGDLCLLFSWKKRSE
ncbi:glucose-6-phosphate 1-dehydrogenase-like [Palaemon carinicauda]|uniref:glucose-6-phosphate 1-dehydrogenase-like n=1 Tax=Palaemon carinicauda TaxID=392227 RepID=UPI0035B5AD9F